MRFKDILSPTGLEVGETPGTFSAVGHGKERKKSKLKKKSRALLCCFGWNSYISQPLFPWFCFSGDFLGPSKRLFRDFFFFKLFFSRLLKRRPLAPPARKKVGF